MDRKKSAHNICHFANVVTLSALTLALFASYAVIAGAPASAQAQRNAQPALIQKDPKISSILRALCDEIPQREGPIDPSQREDVISAVQSHSFSKAIADAIHSRSMRISTQSEVQAYIEVDEINFSSIKSLQSLGVRIEIEADSKGNSSNRRAFSKIPTLQAEIPVEEIRQVEELPFVRYVRLPDYGLSSSGSVTSQGDHILQADAVRNTMYVDGTGINVGVISSGIGGVFANAGCTTSCEPLANTPATPSPIVLGNLPNSTGTRTNGILTSVAPVLPLTPGNGSFTAMESYRADKDLEDTAAGSEGAEGTALLEIVHDLAPGANLNFANYQTGLEFEEAVDALAATNDIVVDDALFTEASYDGNSSISVNTANALNNNGNEIRAYITSAGNYALDHYAGTFTPSGVDGLSLTGQPGALHQFSGIPYTGQPQPDVNLPAYQTIDMENLGMEPFDPVLNLPPQKGISVSLSWNDKIGASSNDYDLFLFQLTCASSQGRLPAGPCTINGAPVAASTNAQTGTQNPFESLSYTNPYAETLTYGIVIQNVGNLANPVTFDMFITGYGDKMTAPNHNFNTVSGSIPVPGDSLGSPVSVITVGAVNQVQCSSPDNCTGLLEGFSSQGPTQITPENPIPYNKPNIVAVDEVCITGAGGFGNPNIDNVSCPVAPPYSFIPTLFGGTSAAAPHVAAIAALTLEMAPCLLYANGGQTASTARSILYNALTGGSPPGLATPTLGYPSPLPGHSLPLPNDAEGYGLVDAFASATGMLPVPTAFVPVSSSATSGNGAPVLLTAGKLSYNQSGCQPVAIQWGGYCGANKADATQATVQCPIGVGPVSVGVSVNGSSFLPQAEVPTSNVIVTDFTLSSSSYSASPVTVSSGAPALFTIQVVSTGQGAFTNPVALACQASGLPPGASCLFSPASVTPSTGSGNSANPVAVTSSLTIFTTGPTSSFTDPLERGFWWEAAALWICFAILLCGLCCLSPMRRRGLYYQLGICVLGAAIYLGISSCGSKTSTQPAKTYTVTIMGTSNQLMRTTTLTLNVN